MVVWAPDESGVTPTKVAGQALGGVEVVFSDSLCSSLWGSDTKRVRPHRRGDYL